MALLLQNQDFLVLDSVDSTNTHLANGDFPDGTICIARHQSAGRGRRGRTWHGRSGDAVLFSGLLESRSGDFAVERLPYVPLLTGLAALRAAQSMLDLHASTDGGPARLWLKWPNDVYLERGGTGKVAGVLVESALRGFGALRIVVGVGLNFFGAPEATEIETAAVPPVALLPQARTDREGFELYVPEFVREFNSRSHELKHSTPPKFLDEIRELDYLRGRTVRSGGEEHTARGIADSGHLLLERHRDGRIIETEDAGDLEPGSAAQSFGA